MALLAAVLFGGVAVASQNGLVVANGVAELNRVNAGWASATACQNATVAVEASKTAQRQWSEATRQTRIAVARRLVAESELVRPDSPTLSGLLAIASSRLEPLRESWRTLFEFNSRFPGVIASIPVADAGGGILNDDGTRMLLFRDKRSELWNLTPRRQIWTETKPVATLALSRSGRYVAYLIGSELVVRDVDSKATWHWPVDARRVKSLVFSPDEQWVAITQDQNVTVLWKVRQPEQSLRLAHDSEQGAVMFGRGGQVLTILGRTASVWRLDAATKPVA